MKGLQRGGPLCVYAIDGPMAWIAVEEDMRRQ